MDPVKIVHSGVTMKPKVNIDFIYKLINEYFGLNCVSVKQLNGYDDNNYHIHVNSMNDNRNIDHICADGYVLKVMNSRDSKRIDLMDAQNELLLHLRGRNNICCPRPVKAKNGTYFTTVTFSSGIHIVRLLEFISGSILHKVPCTSQLFYEVGKYVASVDQALKDFRHIAFESHESLWMLQSVPKLMQFLYAVKEHRKRKLVEDIIEQFNDNVLSVCHNFEMGMIHGDFNEQNIVVEQSGSDWRVKAILDFGDSHLACYLFELAITMAYMILQGRNIEIGGYVLAGYISIRELPDVEYRLLKICIAARLCQSLVLGAYSSLQDPDNDYVLTTSKTGWSLLENLWAQPNQFILDNWRSILQKQHF